MKQSDLSLLEPSYLECRSLMSFRPVQESQGGIVRLEIRRGKGGLNSNCYHSLDSLYMSSPHFLQKNWQNNHHSEQKGYNDSTLKILPEAKSPRIVDILTQISVVAKLSFVNTLFDCGKAHLAPCSHATPLTYNMGSILNYFRLCSKSSLLLMSVQHTAPIMADTPVISPSTISIYNMVDSFEKPGLFSG